MMSSAQKKLRETKYIERIRRIYYICEKYRRSKKTYKKEPSKGCAYTYAIPRHCWNKAVSGSGRQSSFAKETKPLEGRDSTLKFKTSTSTDQKLKKNNHIKTFKTN